MDRRLELELNRVGDRYRRMGVLVGWTVCWLAVAVLDVILAAVGRTADWDVRVPAIAAAIAGLAAAIGVYGVMRRRAENSLSVARRIEQRFPELDHRLLTAVEQDRGWPPARLGYLQELVVRQAYEHSQVNQWLQTIPTRRLLQARVGHASALALMATSLVLVLTGSHASLGARAGAGNRPLASSSQVVVEPGDTLVERGSDVLVFARFLGPLPADVHVVFDGPGGEKSLPLAPSLNDPLFGGRIPSVTNNLNYHVEFDGKRSRTYRVAIFEYPEVTRIDATISFPEYTAQPPKRLEDTRHVTAVEGSEVTLVCQLNKPVKRAWIQANSGEQLELAAAPQKPTELRLTIPLRRTQRYTVHLTDGDGRANKLPPELTLTALANRLPELVMKFPGDDTRASPIEELAIQATAWDDFGIPAIGITYMLAGQAPQSVTLSRAIAAKEQCDVQHIIYLEDLAAQPDELLSYHAWAEDIGPDGKPRRACSDMFFVEVRPFDEIYRQGEQPTASEMRRQQEQQGQQGAAQQATELAELQKQIMNATWNLIRKTDHEPSELAKDAGVVRDSQKSALEQVRRLAGRASSANPVSSVEQIERHMSTAVEQLAKAAEGPAAEPLEPALSAEQAAYQELLRMRAREHRVMRGQMAQGGGQSDGNRADRQLQELELDNRENRYETRRTPSPAQQQAAREDNQVLNRLRELARRQEDLNKRIQELQSALQAARDPAQREELSRQLERLRDEQQEMLRDLDELRDRMDRAENQQRMADARQRLDETRQNMRQASESLREQQLAPALNSGTRAQRDLQEVRDEFRRRTANEFADEMRSMRDSARDLSRREQELGDKLNEISTAPLQSLRDNGRSNLVEQMSDQRKRLTELMDQMKVVSEAAETGEPLLSRQLYDTLRESSQRNIDRSMEFTSELLRRGFLPEATEAEQTVRRDVDELRKGVERAARGVLGDQAEATRRALEEVEDLTRQLQQEIAQADPSGERSATQLDESNEPIGDPPRRPGQRSGAERQSDQPEQPDAAATSRAETGEPPPRGNRSSPTSSGLQQDQPSDGQPARAPGPGDDRNIDLSGWTGPSGPITGEQFREWTDRLRDVEEMLDNPDLRSEIAGINDRAREVRRDLKRHSKEPNWSLVRRLIAEPLVELQSKLREELARQEPSDKLVPIDRDPVPRRYSDLVREYYERLGSGK